MTENDNYSSSVPLYGEDCIQHAPDIPSAAAGKKSTSKDKAYIIEFDRVWRVGEVDVQACSSCRSIQMFVSFSGFLTASLYTSDNW